ncbi:TetR/AcrR family transcriptional regulator [Adhaeribacter pallidiroseus]|uniref:HTH-type transcriptional repressor KstR2 n=1 Tax=Adhaeribacter pallidiroseus TaxID=2072847 RepID=A0A369QG94_9BACT|nr:TetR/AcrR family transcriptional regulator [Adhaeribacter pallidiroseus]RDC62287.1 HTH-type transcriptional repressor KstR2 [Adhaeribacter pallidiroseus]
MFLEKGFDGTTTRDIAQEAGMNGALLNYYFRSKEKLFSLVFNELFELNFRGMLQIMNEPISLKEKITGLIDHDFQIFKSNPGLVTFLQNELHRNPDRFLNAICLEKSRIISVFDQQLQQAIEAGEVRPITIPHVLQLIAANVQFIFQSKVMVTRLWQMNNEEFERFVADHQQIVKDMICNYLFLPKADC